MTQPDERVVVGVIERSVLVTMVERLAFRLRTAATRSRAFEAARPIIHAAARYGGVTILAAVATHVLLVSAVSPPPSWYWLILPALFTVAGAALIVLRD